MLAQTSRDPIDLRQAEDMLRHVDAHDRDTWVQVAKALAAEYGPAGEPVFLAWSATAENFKERPARDTWRSALRKPGRYSVGTIVRFALDGGYQFERMAPEQRAAAMERLQALREQARIRAEQAQHQQALAALRAEERALLRWRAAEREGESPYVLRKLIERPEACRFEATGELLLPMLRYDLPREQSLKGLQSIDSQGVKRFTGGMAKLGTACRLGLAEAGAPVLVCEGWATGMSIRMATGRRLAMYVAFDAGNLGAVVAMIPKLHPRSPVLICADDDWLTRDRAGRPLNPGRVAAAEAAQALTDQRLLAAYVHPVFPPRVRADVDTDFNDLHARCGLAAVAAQVERALLMLTMEVRRG